MREERNIETYQNLLMEISNDLLETREKAYYLQLALTKACCYLTRGYVDTSEKTNYTAMQWEDYLLEEVKNAD